MANDYYPQGQPGQQPTQRIPQHMQQPYPNQAAAQQQYMRFSSYNETTTGEWVLNLLLVAIPLIGLILLFVWAFGSGTAPSKRNWARANLIWILIGIIISIAIVVIASVSGVSLQQLYSRS